MFSLVNAVAKATSRVDALPSALELDTAHIVIIPRPKPGSYGISFADDMLLVDYGSAMSFRVKYCNLGLHKEIVIRRAPKSFPSPILKDYFTENHDNPYALIYVIGRMAVRSDVTTPLTRVPPVVTKYDSRGIRAQAIARLLKEAQPMDLLFSHPIQSSEVSRVIRAVDQCQFSHVSMYIGNGLTVDAGPSGVHRTSIAEFAETAHLALYRCRELLSEEQRAKAVRFMNEQVGGGYNWIGVAEVFLRKKFGLKPRIPSVSDLLFSDSFQLITHV